MKPENVMLMKEVTVLLLAIGLLITSLTLSNVNHRLKTLEAIVKPSLEVTNQPARNP